MSALMHDIRFGFRMMKKSWGVTAFAVLALAIGIGANTALFTVIHGVLLSPFSFPDPERLFFIFETKKGLPKAVSGVNYNRWREQNTVFDQVCAIAMDKMNMTGEETPLALTGFRVTANYFDTFQNPPSLGRGFVTEEAVSGNQYIVVLGHTIWQSRFNSDPGIIGKNVNLDGHSYTIVGIARPSVGFSEEIAQYYRPITNEELFKEPYNHFLSVIGRLKENVTIEQARVEMNTIAARLEQEWPDLNAGRRTALIPFQEIFIQEIRPGLNVLYGSVCFLLLIACVNIANLLLAKSGARCKEIAIRRALGAGRLRIIRQILIESVILSLIGGFFGLLLAVWGLDLLKLFTPKISFGNGEIPGFQDLHINSMVLMFTFTVSVTTGLFFGLIPAWQISKVRINESLKECSRVASSGSGRYIILDSLVVSEIALALILLIGSSLLISSYYKLQTDGPGFSSERILAVEIERPRTPANETVQSRAAFCKQTIEKIRTIPQVESVDAINLQPLNGVQTNNRFEIVGHPPTSTEEAMLAEDRKITPGYFETMGIPLIQGRYLTTRDDGTGPHVIVINEKFIRRYFPNENPIGRRIVLAGKEKEIVGVVGNVRLRSLSPEKITPFMYEPIDQDCWRLMTFLIKTKDNFTSLTDAIRQAIWDVDPSQPILRVQTMDRVVSDSVSLERFSTILFGLMAGVALVLALIGIYGVMAYSVYERSREIGIRIALGAKTSDIIKSVLIKGSILTGVGTVIGLTGSLVLTQFMSAILYKVETTDPVTFCLVPILLNFTAVAACYIPARKAANVDPMISIRSE